MGLVDPTSQTSEAQQQPLSPRVESLSGKKIGLYDGGKPTSEPVLDVVEEELRSRYPDATFDRYELGKQGVNKVKDPEEMSAITQWASEMDVCIGAYGDCGSCTKFIAWGIEAIEDSGTPAVGLIDEGFDLDYKRNAIERGRPLRFVTLPVRSETPQIDIVRERMNTENIDAIVDELTRPLTGEEQADVQIEVN